MEKGFKLNFFNEVSRDKIKIDESDFKPMQEIKLPEKKAPEKEKESEPERDEEPQQQEIIHDKVDYENFLRNQTVKDLIKQALEDSKDKKSLKGTLALILQKRRPTTYEEIRKSLGVSDASGISRAV